MFSDIRYSLRQLAKRPGFTTVAVLTLSLGIGLNAAMLRSLRPVLASILTRDEAQKIVSIFTETEDAAHDFREFSYAEFQVLQNSRDVFSEVGAVDFNTNCLVGVPGNLRHGVTGLISSAYLRILGARPSQGRFFSEDEARPNASIPVVVASSSLWQRLGGSPAFVGSQILINGQPCMVIGIISEQAGNLPGARPEVWVPLGLRHLISGDLAAPSRDFGPKDYALSLVGRLAPGVNLSSARSRLAAIDRLLNTPPFGDPSVRRQLMVASLPRFSITGSRPKDESGSISLTFMAIALAASVQLVACLNLSNMLLARGVERQKEIAIRLSLGASRWRIVRQFLIESALLALAALVAGEFLSGWCIMLIDRVTIANFSAAKFAVGSSLPWSSGDLMVALALGVCSVMIFGLGPALRATQVNLVDDLKRQPGQPAEGGRWNRLFSPQHTRMMAQIALSFMLISIAGLILRGARDAMNASPGFVTTREIVVNVDYRSPGLANAAVGPKAQALLLRASALPGVAGAALATAVPFNYDGGYERLFHAGDPAISQNSDNQASIPAPICILTSVTNGYFSQLGIPLRGRDFTVAESTLHQGQRVGIIDESLAKEMFGDKEALGQHVSTWANDKNARSTREFEIIGIVRSPHEYPFEGPVPHRIYRPLAQIPYLGYNIYLHLKLSDPTMSTIVADGLRRESLLIDPNASVLTAQPLAEIINKNIGFVQARLTGFIFGIFGFIALVLALIGVYGVKAHSVARRTREFGIRIALGSTTKEVLALVIRQAALQTAIGLGAGLALTFLVGQAIAKNAYHMHAVDPIAVSVAFVVLAVTAIGACLMPALRATRVDPVVTLRAE